MADKKTKNDAENALPTPPPRLKLRYRDEIAPKVGQRFGIKNKLALPAIEKIIINVGMGKELQGTKLDPKAREQVVSDLAMITGQQPVVKQAKKSVSNFKLRAGYEVGAMVTVRGDRMWELLDRLINLAIPRIKDFRGLGDKKFDGRGNYAFGITEQAIFPEIDMAAAQYTHGMNIQIVFKNSNDELSHAVMSELGWPFVSTRKAKEG
ncbi:MAG: 50S ribosomal protein L5 [Planctomycetota bacterium]